MKKIVAPTDYSTTSVNAVNYAADLACAVNADLTIIHVFTIPVTYGEVPVQEFSAKEIFEGAEESMNILRKKIVARVGEKIKIHTELIEGDVVVSIKDYCKSVQPYAVVMGSESGNAYERFLFGAKTVSAMKRLSWPLLVVPPEAKFESIQKIGLACDLKEVIGSTPVDEIKNLVNEFKAELHILHVDTKHPGSFKAETITESGWLQEMLSGLKPQYDFIEGDDVEEEINRFAEKNKLDLLIVIPKKRHFVDKIFQHSHSKRLVLHTHVPVMAVHE
ncbi:MAG TPA: universal stress protein [Puia sp.]|nr:universal stress protein [Puia sp.]